MRTKKSHVAISELWKDIYAMMLQVSRNHKPSLWHRDVGEPLYKMLRCIEAGHLIVQDTTRMDGAIKMHKYDLPKRLINQAVGLCLLDFKAGDNEITYSLHPNARRLLLEIDIGNRKSHAGAIPQTSRALESVRFRHRKKA